MLPAQKKSAMGKPLATRGLLELVLPEHSENYSKFTDSHENVDNSDTCHSSDVLASTAYRY